jgi:hypothetical protein
VTQTLKIAKLLRSFAAGKLVELHAIEPEHAKLLKLEIEEETLIMAAARDGVAIDRRGDADPRAIFAVVDEAAA